MDKDPTGRGIREWKLFLNNPETNVNNSLEYVQNRANDDELVIGNRQLPSTTRAFGDFHMTLHLGEIYFCTIPTDRNVALFCGCDGFEESVDRDLIPKYLCDPKGALGNLLSEDHKFVKMYNNYKDWFLHQKIGHLPEEGVVNQLNWLQRCVQYVGHSHLPSQRDCEVIAGAVQWLQWAFHKYSSKAPTDPSNKFNQPFADSVRFRLKFLVQSALARLSFDNISGVIIAINPTQC